MLGLGLGIGLTACAAWQGGDPSAPALFQSVNAAGWSVTYATPPDLDPDGAPQYFTVLRQGYNAQAQPVTISENLICTKRIRQPYPNQTLLTADQVALSDYVYATDIIPGVSNASAELSPKPICAWALPDRGIVGNVLVAELVAFHRNASGGEQVAAVEFYVSDGTTTVTQIVSASVVSGRAGDRGAVIVYRASIDVSSLANPAALTLNARVFPHIGGAASVADSATGTLAREFSPRKYLRNVALAAAPVYVYVSPSGNDTTGVVSSDAAAASAAPCLTIGGAINRIIAVSGAVDGHVIRLKAGTYTTVNAASTRAQTAGELVITRDPAALRSEVILSLGTSSFRPRLGAAGGWIRLQDITIVRTAAFSFSGEAASRLRVVIDACDFNNGGFSASLYATSDGIWLGTEMTNPGASTLNASAAGETFLYRGFKVGPSMYGLEARCVLGCDLTGGGPLGYGGRDISGSIVAFNRFSNVGTSGAFNPTQAGMITGIALVQNVFEYISATTGPAITLSATGGITHAVVHHNTTAGFYSNGRGLYAYDEAATPRTHKLLSFCGNIHGQINHKGDVFDSNGSLLGNWGYLFGVGCQGEWSLHIDAQQGGIGGAFAQAYPGAMASIGTSASLRNDPLFVDYKATTSGPSAGAGDGNYALQAGSPAKGRVKPVLKYDIVGAARSASLASAGAYE